MLNLLNEDLKESAWIDGQGRQVLLRSKALPEVLNWLQTTIRFDIDFNDDIGKQAIYQLFLDIDDTLSNPTINESFATFINEYLLFQEERHLPIPVYLYICPSMPHQFILHILLSFGRFATEIDLIQHSSLRKAFRYAKLIGMNEDDESLLKYSDQLFTRYIEEQLIFFPNSRQIIDTWIQDAGDIFDDVIIKGSIPITEMPSVQLTSLLKSEEEKCTTLIKKLKKQYLMQKEILHTLKF